MATRHAPQAGEHRRREPERRSEPERGRGARQARLAELLAEQRQVVEPGRPRHVDTQRRHADASRKAEASSTYADDIAEWAGRYEVAGPAAHAGARDNRARAAVRNLVVAPPDRWRGGPPEWVAPRSRTADRHLDAPVRTLRARAVRDLDVGEQPTGRSVRAPERRRGHVDSDANPRSHAADHLRSGLGHYVDARRGELDVDVDVGTAVAVRHRHVERIGPAGRGRREIQRRSQRLGSARRAGAVLHDRRQRRRPRCGTSQRAPRALTRQPPPPPPGSCAAW
jgi:hypothetical protein